jgi:hypothetical protein
MAQQQTRNRAGQVVTVEQPSLLDSLLAETELRQTALPPVVQAVPTIVPVESREVEVQLLDWHFILVACPGCGCYPCKTGHMNGHTEEWICTPGDIVKVAI